MDESDFEGTLILEKLAEIGKLDEFYAAVDSEDIAKVRSLLKRAQMDAETIGFVLDKISNG